MENGLQGTYKEKTYLSNQEGCPVLTQSQPISFCHKQLDIISQMLAMGVSDPGRRTTLRLHALAFMWL